MAAPAITSDRLRRLTEVRPESGRVLSVFVNLDPSEFAAPPARATQVTSLMAEGRSLLENSDLEHDARETLQRDLRRVEEWLRQPDIGGGGARGLALYAAESADLFEVVKLPAPVDGRVVIDEAPVVEPLVAAGAAERWCVLLCNRQVARVLVGVGVEGLEEVDRIEDEVHQQHDQGGWSQQRYQRSVEEEVYDHLKHVSDVLLKRLGRHPFDHLLIGAPQELVDEVETRLHPYVRERVAGRLSIDVEHSTTQDVRNVCSDVIEEHLARREREVLDRLLAGLGRGERAAAGPEAVMAALEQAAVDTLLVEAGVAEKAIERTIEQGGDVLIVSRHPDLGPHGGIGAILRF